MSGLVGVCLLCVFLGCEEPWMLCYWGMIRNALLGDYWLLEQEEWVEILALVSRVRLPSHLSVWT